MKKMIALAALLVSTSAYALSEASSWSEVKSAVKNNVYLTLEGGTVFAGQLVSAFNVCVEGSNFVSTKKYPIYKTKYVGKARDNDGDNDGYTSVVVGYKTLTYPMAYSSYDTVCANNGKRCRKVSKTVYQDDVVTFSVKKSKNTFGKDNVKAKTLFTKTYTIPACN